MMTDEGKPKAVQTVEELDELIEDFTDVTQKVEVSSLEKETFEQAEEVGDALWDLKQEIEDEFGIKTASEDEEKIVEESEE